MDLLKKNPNIGFALEHAVAVKPAKKACKFSMRYASVIGSGTAVILEDLEEKSFGLNIVTAHYNAKPEQFSEAALSGLSVVRIDIHQMSYKETGLE